MAMHQCGGPDSVLFLRHPDGQWLVGWGHFERQAHASKKDPSFYLPDFFREDPNPWWIPEHFATLSTPELKAKWPVLFNAGVAQSWQWQEPSVASFEQDISQALTLIKKGELKKMVPITLSESSHIPTLTERWGLWARLTQVPSRWIAYGGWWNDEGLLGLSPEILFSTQAGWTETMALAGTAKADSPSLLESSKDLSEHQWVVDDLVEQLSKLGVVQKTPTREWLLGRLKHLRTDLAVAQGASFETLVDLLHPTPALGVAPRAAGLSALKTAANAHLRRRFGAPFGVEVPEQFGFACVAIRGLQWHEGKSWLASGCGVVEASDPKHEWEELRLKRAVVQEQLGVGP